MISQKYYNQALVSASMLIDGIEAQYNVFGWLEHNFKRQIAEANMGLLSHITLRVEHPSNYLLKYTPPGMLRVNMVARVVPIQRLENVESQ